MSLKLEVRNNVTIRATEEVPKDTTDSKTVSLIAQAIIGGRGALLQTAKVAIKIPLVFLVTILGMDELESLSLKGIAKDFIMIGVLIDHVAHLMFDTLFDGEDKSSPAIVREYVHGVLMGTDSSYQGLEDLFNPSVILVQQ